MMKTLWLLSVLLLSLGSGQTTECGDGTTYAAKHQTELDKRFDGYPKIAGKGNAPQFPGGDKKLDDIIRSQLRLSDVARTQIFNLNYKFTVTCEGKVRDIVQIGDPRMDDWTNIVEIISKTEGWKPARKNGNAVDCVYFRRFMINGGLYPQ